MWLRYAGCNFTEGDSVMTIDEMIRRKRELGYSNEKISELSGVPVGTIQKIFSGQTKSPRYTTLLALERMFDEVSPGGSGPSLVREPLFVYDAGASRDKYDGWRGKKQGEFTLEDYYALPEDQQAELIDGVIYDMTAPALTHQQALVFLVRKIGDHIFTNKGKCVLSAAPTDVRLDLDDRTMVQPDVLVVCERDQLIRRRVEGAPDLVIEILSPSTRRKDLRIKSGKYARAGVRELWLVDLRDLRVIVYEFDEIDRISNYTLRDRVPVGIFGGRLAIDFSELDDYLTELFGEDWNYEENELRDS